MGAGNTLPDPIIFPEGTIKMDAATNSRVLGLEVSLWALQSFLKKIPQLMSGKEDNKTQAKQPITAAAAILQQYWLA